MVKAPPPPADSDDDSLCLTDDEDDSAAHILKALRDARIQDLKDKAEVKQRLYREGRGQYHDKDEKEILDMIKGVRGGLVCHIPLQGTQVCVTPKSSLLSGIT